MPDDFRDAGWKRESGGHDEPARSRRSGGFGQWLNMMLDSAQLNL
jgi:hypothetical protein